MRFGYRPPPKQSTSKPAPAIRMGMLLHRHPDLADRMLTDTLSERDLPAFLQGDGKDTPKRVAEDDWTKPYGDVD